MQYVRITDTDGDSIEVNPADEEIFGAPEGVAAIIRITFPKGTLHPLGFDASAVYLTAEQVETLKEALA